MTTPIPATISATIRAAELVGRFHIATTRGTSSPTTPSDHRVLQLVQVGQTRFSPPATLEGVDLVTAQRVLPYDCDEQPDIALTVLFGTGSGTDTHGMSLILVSPDDQVTYLYGER